MRGYTQLTQEERYQIYILRRAGQSQSAIAAMLRRSKSTISRELGHNRGGLSYRAKQAEALVLTRHRARAETVSSPMAFVRILPI